VFAIPKRQSTRATVCFASGSSGGNPRGCSTAGAESTRPGTDRRTAGGSAAGVATVNACSFSLTCDGGLLQHGAPSGPRGAAPGEVVGALADIYTLAGDSGRRETRQLRKTKTTGSANLVSSWVLAMRRRCREAANRTSDGGILARLLNNGS
jgi:hypothetical protein